MKLKVTGFELKKKLISSIHKSELRVRQERKEIKQLCTILCKYNSMEGNIEERAIKARRLLNCWVEL